MAENIKAIITDPVGLHARPAALLVKKSSEFNSDIILKFEGKEANLKSIMSIMSLGVKKNSEIIIEISGNDEVDAKIEIIKLLKENKIIA